MPTQLNVAVCGAGAFGRNHLRVYRELEQTADASATDSRPLRLAAIVEADAQAAPRLREEWGIPVFCSLEECLEDRRKGHLALDAVSVCVPTSAHYTAASLALAEGLDVLLEKPIAATLAEADALVLQASTAGRILQIGHLERFNPAVAAVMPLLNRPMFFEAHRLSVFTPRALDVDVVLDLMIHDLDVVLSLVRSPVLELRAAGLPILSSKVDIANVRLEFVSGAVANFTASRVSTEKVRKLRFFQPHQYVSIDYARQDLLLIGVNRDETRNETMDEIRNETGNESNALLRGGNLHPETQSVPGLTFAKPAVRSGEPLQLEIRAFLHAVRTRTPPRVTAEEGRDALALALAINREMEAHAQRAGLQR